MDLASAKPAARVSGIELMLQFFVGQIADGAAREEFEYGMKTLILNVDSFTPPAPLKRSGPEAQAFRDALSSQLQRMFNPPPTLTEEEWMAMYPNRPPS